LTRAPIVTFSFEVVIIALLLLAIIDPTIATVESIHDSAPLHQEHETQKHDN
jgi:hypothetical protein